MDTQASTFPKLPPQFRFCVSTAAHQIEGQNTNSDWWLWENTPGKIKNGDTSLRATASWDHVDEDIQNMKQLGIDTYRFSIEWAKIQPTPNTFNDAELARYVGLIDRLQQNGIESMITLYHFTLPIWVSKQGGWDWEGIAPAFQTFTERVAKAIGPRVKIWITLNEPMTIIAAGYVSNIFPPAKNDAGSIGLPMKNMVRAHALAYHTIHERLDSLSFKPRVGLAHHLRIFDPIHPHNPVGRFIAQKFDEVFNWAIPIATQTGVLKFKVPFLAKADEFIPEAANTQDFFGLNYYSRDLVGIKPFSSPPLERQTKKGAELTDLGWEIYPEGMSRLLYSIREKFPKMPIWITENGLDDKSDQKRKLFLNDHFKVLEKHIQEGAPIEGYCHWTLNDNFEWAEGYSAHFGFYALEPATLKRVPRPSARWFSDLIQSTRGR